MSYLDSGHTTIGDPLSSDPVSYIGAAVALLALCGGGVVAALAVLTHKDEDDDNH